MRRFTLRALDTLSLDVVSDLHRAAFAPLGERAWTRQEIAELLASPGVGGRLLELVGKAIGFALHRHVADEAEVLTIAVDPDRRRQGAGRALLDSVIAQARISGARSLFLEVGADNPAARALYRQAGFETVGSRTGYYRRGAGPSVDALVMRLRLGE